MGIFFLFYFRCDVVKIATCNFYYFVTNNFCGLLLWIHQENGDGGDEYFSLITERILGIFSDFANAIFRFFFLARFFRHLMG